MCKGVVPCQRGTRIPESQASKGFTPFGEQVGGLDNDSAFALWVGLGLATMAPKRNGIKTTDPR
jgi:hypothetical protein